MEFNANASIFIYSFMALISLLVGCEATSVQYSRSHLHRLFVFGDSYADTGNLGNLGRELTRCWYEPYGMTFPHVPAGRFSDGKILTDFIASFLGIRSPVPYKIRRKVISSLFSSGMNFAVAGSGVFDLGNFQRNLSCQIDTFQSQINSEVFTKHDLTSSIALVSVSGNDYSHFLEQGGKPTEILGFIRKLIDQLKLELERIKGLGVGKVVVTNLTPLGCSPYITRPNHYKCDANKSAAVLAHNDRLRYTIQHLIKDNEDSNILVLDLYSAFFSIIKEVQGVRKFMHILKPCCEGKTAGSSCGQTDDKGKKMYTVCKNPGDYLYWDDVHPTQAGWDAVFQVIKPWLAQNLI